MFSALHMKVFMNLFFVTSISLFTKKTFAQNVDTITGYVKDSIGQKVLKFSTVVLRFQGQQNNNVVTTTYTDSSGKFIFTNLNAGTYQVIVSNVGFQEKSTSLTIPTTTNDELTVYLQPVKGILAGITVVGRKSLVEQKADRIIFNTDADPSAKGESAIDILRRVPFVSVDGEGNVQVNGQTNFKVLVNGKETSLFTKNVPAALKAFPGAVISRIEVITSPSAKYDAEGIGGVIDIITTKKVIGVNGNLSIFARTPNNTHRSTATVNAKFGKLGFVANLWGGRFESPLNVNQQTFPLVTTIFTKRTLAGEGTTTGNFYSGNTELNYEFDSLKTISLYGNFNRDGFKSKIYQVINTDLPSIATSVSDYNSITDNRNRLFNIGFDITLHAKKQKTEEFSLRTLLESWKNYNDPFSLQTERNSNRQRHIMNTSIADNKEFTTQADYIKPLKNSSKIETGVKLIIRKAVSDFESRFKYGASGEYQVDIKNSNYFEYDQNVYSLYSLFGFKISKINYRVGFRIEHTEVNGNFKTASTNINEQYTNFFPNLQAAFKLSSSYNMVVSYNKRLQRPYASNLNPFINNNDSLNISFGNPNLGPQIFHSVAVQNRFSSGNTFIGLTLTGSLSNNAITAFSLLDKVTGVTKTTSDNIGKQRQLILNGSVNTKFSKNLSGSFTGSVNYTDISNKLEPSVNNNGINGNGNISGRYELSKKLNLAGFAGFSRSAVGIQSSYPLFYFYGTSLSCKAIENRLTVNFQFFAPFTKTIDYTSKTKDSNFVNINTSTRPLRSFGIFVLWQFGKLKGETSRKKGVQNDDVLKESKEN